MEIAFVSTNKLRFELEKKQRNLISSILTIFYSRPQQFISTMHIGNIISVVAFGILIVKGMTSALLPIGNVFWITTIQVFVATLIVLITAEFIPKTLFRINSNLWLRIFSWVLLLSYTLIYPLSMISNWLATKISEIFKLKIKNKSHAHVFSRSELNYLLQETIEGNETEKEVDHEVKYFQNALDFSKVRLRDCSVPRTEIIALEIHTDVEVLRQTFIETGFSKIPIYKENIDNIVGYIHSSEMFQHQKDWRKYIRQMPIVPENMTAHKLMNMFMQQKRSMAVVVDEFGGTNGIITLEDIMEVIFGKIEDEHDIIAYTAQQITETEFLFSGRLEVQTANEKFNLHIPESDEYDTIAGFILHHHQHFPKINEVIRIENFSLKCIKATNNRIELVRLVLGS